MILDSVEPAGIVSVSPRCTEPQSRIAAYMLLVELCRSCHDNLVAVAKQLVKLHHHDNPQFAKEWEVSLSDCAKTDTYSLPDVYPIFCLVPASSGWSVIMWVCRSEKCRSYLLHELCTTATLHDQTS